MTLLDIPVTGTDPFALFRQWFEDAKGSEPADADAACLCTTDVAGGIARPSARMVLVRRVDSRGFVFFTNENSRKGRQLRDNPYAALCWHWKSRERQVRVEGMVEDVSAQESDEYFNSRPRGSRVGAWASAQSDAVDSRAALLARVEAAEKHYAERDVPRPPHWHGFRVVPTLIEFWQQGEFRIHDRFVFTRDAGAWTAQRLYP